MTQPDLARLERLLTRLRTMDCYGHKPYPTHFINPDGEEAATKIETLLARVRELTEALEEIAGAYDKWDPDANFSSTILSQVSCRARAALTLKENDDG